MHEAHDVQHLPLAAISHFKYFFADNQESMEVSLQHIAMEHVLREGIPYGHLSPQPVVEKVTQFFFREMFVDMVEQLQGLVEICSDPHADEEDRMELIRIIKTYSAVEKRYDIRVEERFIQSTSELIELAEDLVEVVESTHFREFTQFVEYLIVLFIDDSFNLPIHEDYTDEVILYHLRHAIL